MLSPPWLCTCRAASPGDTYRTHARPHPELRTPARPARVDIRLPNTEQPASSASPTKMAGVGMNTAVNNLLSPRDLATGTGGSGAATTLHIKFHEYEGVDWKKVGIASRPPAGAPGLVGMGAGV